MVKRNLGVTSFAPSGPKTPCIYAVVLRDHPDVVKVGRAQNWKSRFSQYRNWNLRSGDGILTYDVFEMHEEYVDMSHLEGELVSSMRSIFPVKQGLEWFIGDRETAVRIMDRLMTLNDICHTHLVSE